MCFYKLFSNSPLEENLRLPVPSSFLNPPPPKKDFWREEAVIASYKSRLSNLEPRPAN